MGPCDDSQVASSGTVPASNGKRPCRRHRCTAALDPQRTSATSPSRDVEQAGTMPHPCARTDRLAVKACAEFGYAFTPSLARQHGLVDDDARLAPVLDVEHCLYVGGAVARETLVGPAQGVRRQDDVVELKERIARIGRLLLENI